MQFAKDDTGLHIYNISEVVLDAVCIMQYREPFSLSCHCLPRGDLDSWMTSASKISLMIQTFQGVREIFSLYVEFLKSCMVRITLMYCRQDSCSFGRRGPCVYVCMPPLEELLQNLVAGEGGCAWPRPSRLDLVLQSASLGPGYCVSCVGWLSRPLELTSLCPAFQKTYQFLMWNVERNTLPSSLLFFYFFSNFSFLIIQLCLAKWYRNIFFWRTDQRYDGSVRFGVNIY